MKTTGNRILITGGSSGIGLAFAKAFTSIGNDIMVCARSQADLEDAASKVSGLKTFRCDISKEEGRRELFKWANDIVGVNMLINNAGIQRAVDLQKPISKEEIDTNLIAPIELSSIFMPMLHANAPSAIINVGSGLSFVPMSKFPIYSATKAAMHSFSISLRHQLNKSQIKVFEVIPPIVHDTNLKGKPIEKSQNSVSAEEVALALINSLLIDEYECTIGATKKWSKSSRDELDKTFDFINK